MKDRHGGEVYRFISNKRNLSWFIAFQPFLFSFHSLFLEWSSVNELVKEPRSIYLWITAGRTGMVIQWQGQGVRDTELLPEKLDLNVGRHSGFGQGHIQKLPMLKTSTHSSCLGLMLCQLIEACSNFFKLTHPRGYIIVKILFIKVCMKHW